MGWTSCFVLLLSLALVSGEGQAALGDPVEEVLADDQGPAAAAAAASSPAMECVDPESCRLVKEKMKKEREENGGLSLTLRTLLEDLLAKRVEKRGKQDSGISGFSSAEKRAIVQIHNHLRTTVKPPAANMLEMSWSDELEKVANDYAGTCNFQHNSQRGSQAPSFTSVGENIYAHSNSYNETGAVQAWFNEDQYYNYYTMACSHICGHYTQVVWAKSYKVGCGVKFCNPLRNVRFGSGYIIVCNYGPAGNYRGVKPYEEGNSPTKLIKPPGSTNTNTSPPPTIKPTTTTPSRTRNKNKNRRNRERNRTNRRKSKTKKKKTPRTSKKTSGKTPQASANLQADQPQSPSPFSSSSWKRSLSSTCRRGRSQCQRLQEELQQELNNAQPNSTVWRMRVRKTCSRGRSQLQSLRSRLSGCMRRRS